MLDGAADAAGDVEFRADGLTRLANLHVVACIAGVDGGATKHDARLLCFQVAQTKGRCAENAPANPGGGCKKETDCGGTKGATTYCAVQPKFAQQTGRNVANDLDAGALDVKKDDVLCLPAVAGP